MDAFEVPEGPSVCAAPSSSRPESALAARGRAALLIAAIVASAACEILAPGTWRTDSSTSSVVHVPTEIHFPLRAADLTLTRWDELADMPPTAVATYRADAGDPIVQISLRPCDEPGGNCVAARGAVLSGGKRDPSPGGTELALALEIRDRKVDSTGRLVPGDRAHPSELWIAFRQRDHVALVIMLYAAGSLTDQEAIDRVGDLLDRISWSAPD